MTKIYIATADIGVKGNENLPLNQSAHTEVKTTNQNQPFNFDFEILFANKFVLIFVIVIGIVLFSSLFKSASAPPPKPMPKRAVNPDSMKSRNDSPNFAIKKEQRMKLNYATPSTLNSCIRMFLERTRHK